MERLYDTIPFKKHLSNLTETSIDTSRKNEGIIEYMTESERSKKHKRCCG